MHGINMGRVLVGGVAAGVVINIGESIGNFLLFAEQNAAIMEHMGAIEPGTAAIALFMVLGILLGIGVAWTYAAIRPRCGAGPATGVYAGIMVWSFFYLLPMFANHLMGILGLTAVATNGGWALLFMSAAGYVAGMLYRED